MAEDAGFFDLLAALQGGIGGVPEYQASEEIAPVTVQLVSNSQIQVPVEIVTPDALLSTASYVAVPGSEIDARAWRSLAYTIAIITQSVYWKVFGANASDYSDEVEVQGETSVAAAANGSYVIAQAPFSFYRVKIKNNAGAGTATVRGIAKR